MRSIIIMLLSVITLSVNAQQMEIVNKTVTQLFVATDQRDWSTVESIFSEQVLLDYSSMSGQPAQTLSPEQITDAWKTILPGFSYTHHQLGNFITSVSGDRAEVFCYGTATHYLENKSGSVWTVVGTYHLDLELVNKKWRIAKMKFNFKYQDGNTELPAVAIENLK